MGMGIRGQPIGAAKVQEIIATCGVKPETNAFSQGIIEMREEQGSRFANATRWANLNL